MNIRWLAVLVVIAGSVCSSRCPGSAETRRAPVGIGRCRCADSAGARVSLSPDGRLLAYCSNASGEYQLYVRPFPSGVGQWQVSDQGGCQPRWSRDGKELFYVEGDTLTAVEVRISPAFAAFAMAMSSVLVTLNSLKLRSVRLGPALT